MNLRYVFPIAVFSLTLIFVTSAEPAPNDQKSAAAKKAQQAAQQKAQEAAARKKAQEAAERKKAEEVREAAQKAAAAKKKAQEAAERKKAEEAREAAQKAAAAKKKAQEAAEKKKADEKKAVVAKTNQVERELESVRGLLSKTDHDYKGLRAAAFHEINHALHFIEHGKKHPNPGQNFVASKSKDGDSPKQDDDRLRHAVKTLRAAAGVLDDGVIPHHAQALTAVRKAIDDLERALKQ